MSGRSPRWFTGIKPSYEANFADNTWEQIIAICQKHVVPSTWKIGDQKAMMIGSTDYLVDIIGINHDDYSDGFGKAPFTFQLHDCYEKNEMEGSNTNRNGWAGCAMRQTHLPAILGQLPLEVQNGIQNVNKLTSAGNKSTTIVTTADKLFFPSDVEVFGDVDSSAPGEGKQYQYYKENGSKIKMLDGAESRWWTRSPSINGTTNFIFVSSAGTKGTIRGGAALGVPFCFCF